mmetsp:Transcript_22042/g.50361  ORF Transcript_22042/g.50361 Transcript_22042/m.50361 type:complete len:275 (+) Transcript_22042:468-1292(+)
MDHQVRRPNPSYNHVLQRLAGQGAEDLRPGHVGDQGGRRQRGGHAVRHLFPLRRLAHGDRHDRRPEERRRALLDPGTRRHQARGPRREVRQGRRHAAEPRRDGKVCERPCYPRFHGYHPAHLLAQAGGGRRHAGVREDARRACQGHGDLPAASVRPEHDQGCLDFGCPGQPEPAAGLHIIPHGPAVPHREQPESAHQRQRGGTCHVGDVQDAQPVDCPGHEQHGKHHVLDSQRLQPLRPAPLRGQGHGMGDDGSRAVTDVNNTRPCKPGGGQGS